MHGENLGDALAHADKINKKHKYTLYILLMIHLLIAGQGTVGREILEDEIDYDAVFVPVGGGGLWLA